MEKSIKNKELILKKAFGLFLQKGYKSVSIKDIENATELSKGAIYHHFESKEKILFDALDKYYFNALFFDKSIFAGLTFRNQIEKLYWIGIDIYHKTEFIDEENRITYPIKNVYNFQLECENYDHARDKFKEAANGYRQVVVELVTEALINQEIKKGLNPELISYHIIGILEGVAIHHSTIKNNVKEILAEKFKKIFESYLDLICINDK